MEDNIEKEIREYENKLKKRLKLLFFLLIFVNVIFLVVIPSYMSITHEGGDEGVGGKIEYWANGYAEITLFEESEIFKKHEFVHLYQIKDNRTENFGYLQEIEAYAMSLLPDFLFYKIYNKGYEDDVEIKYEYLENESERN